MAKPRVRIGVLPKDIDKGWERIAAMARTVRESSVHVGVFADSTAEGEPRKEGVLSNVQIAAIHEYGAPTAGIPERSFLRGTYDAKRPEYTVLITRLVQQLYDGKMDVRRALGLVGAKFQADIQARIRAGLTPPLAPSTLRRKLALGRRGAKGEPKPLIDTGQLVASIAYRIVMPGAGARPIGRSGGRAA
jgi:hypothetical protein